VLFIEDEMGCEKMDSNEISADCEITVPAVGSPTRSGALSSEEFMMQHIMDMFQPVLVYPGIFMAPDDAMFMDLLLQSIDIEYVPPMMRTDNGSIKISTKYSGSAPKSVGLASVKELLNGAVTNAARAAIATSDGTFISPDAVPVVTVQAAVVEPAPAVDEKQCPILVEGGCSGAQYEIKSHSDRIYTVNECRVLCAREAECKTFNVATLGRFHCALFTDACDSPTETRTFSQNKASYDYRLSDCNECAEGKHLNKITNECSDVIYSAFELLEGMVHSALYATRDLMRPVTFRDEPVFIKSQRTRLYANRKRMAEQFFSLVGEDCDPNSPMASDSANILEMPADCPHDVTEVRSAFNNMQNWIETFNCNCGASQSFCLQRKKFNKQTYDKTMQHLCDL